MSNRSIAIWFVAGFPVAVLDAWLSIQSMFGLLGPSNFLGYLVAVVSGALLTIFAVYVPIIRGRTTAPFMAVIWILAFTVDLVTSIIGVIWYGAAGNPLSSSIDLSELEFVPANTVSTIVFVGFVLLLAGVCFKFGQALNALNRRFVDRMDTPQR